MATLPSPFLDPGSAPSEPDEAAASVRLTSADAAAEFQFVDASAPSTDEAAAFVPSELPPGAAADLSDIGQIFVGAEKLEPSEIWFENAAYPREDELLFEVLSAMDRPETPDLVSIPDAVSFMIELGPPPLFLQMAS